MSPLRRPHSPTRSLLYAGLAVAFTVIAVPSAGATTTLSRSGNTISLTGDAAADDVTAGRSQVRVTFAPHADGTVLVAGPGCRTLPRVHGVREVDCGPIAKPANPLTLKADLGAGNDRLDPAWASDRHPKLIASGGEGNDLIYGTWLADDIDGGPGDDFLVGGPDRDSMKGGAGNDAVFGGADSDAIFGGTGRDQLFGDLEEGAADAELGGAGMDVIDATDAPTADELAAMTPEQILAIAPEADQVDCGQGVGDAAAIDAADTVNATCEGVSGGGHTPITPNTTPVFPATLGVATRATLHRTSALRGGPIRFITTSSAGGYISAKLELSARDARRLHVPGGRMIAGLTPIVTLAGQPTELFMRLNWTARPALLDEHRITAKLTVVAQHDNAAGTGIESTTVTRTIVLR